MEKINLNLEKNIFNEHLIIYILKKMEEIHHKFLLLKEYLIIFEYFFKAYYNKS